MAEPLHDDRALEERRPDPAPELRPDPPYADDPGLDDSGVEPDDDDHDPSAASPSQESWPNAAPRASQRGSARRNGALWSGVAPRSPETPRPGSEPPRADSSLPRVGSVLAGKYRVERVVAVTGSVVAVNALHVDLGQHVTLKYLLPEASRRPEAVTRFLRSARRAAQLQTEHTARVLDVGRFRSGMPFLVMEDLEGWPLEEVLRVRGALPVQEAVEYVIQACEAVAEAHGLGLVHRALNAKNLMLTRRADDSPLVKVLSFGTSEVQEPNLLGDGLAELRGEDAFLSALPFLSPEQIRGAEDVDERADVWGMGAVLHALLAGAPPFRARTALGLLAAISADSPTPLTAIREDIAPELEATVLRCLDKNMDARFAHMGELALALRPFAPGDALRSIDRISRMSGVGTVPPPLPTPKTRAIVPTTPPPRAVATDAKPAISTSSRSVEASRSPEWLVIAALLGALVGVGGFRALGGMPSAGEARSIVSAPPAAAPAALAVAAPPPAVVLTPPAVVSTPSAALPHPALAVAMAPVAPKPQPDVARSAKAPVAPRAGALASAKDGRAPSRGGSGQGAREVTPAAAAAPKDLFGDTR